MKRARITMTETEEEMKIFDTARLELIPSVVIDWASLITNQNPNTQQTLFSPTRGTDINQRNNRVAWVHSIHIRGIIDIQFQTGATAWTVDEAPLFRVLLIQDTQSNGVNVPTTEILGPTQVFPDVASGILAFQNPSTVSRFKILDEKFINAYEYFATAIGFSTQVQLGKTLTYDLKFTPKEPIKINFNGQNSGSLADIVDNSFSILAGTHPVQGLGTPVMTNQYRCRVMFTG